MNAIHRKALLLLFTEHCLVKTSTVLLIIQRTKRGHSSGLYRNMPAPTYMDGDDASITNSLIPMSHGDDDISVFQLHASTHLSLGRTSTRDNV